MGKYSTINVSNPDGEVGVGSEQINEIPNSCRLVGGGSTMRRSSGSNGSKLDGVSTGL